MWDVGGGCWGTPENVGHSSASRSAECFPPRPGGEVGGLRTSWDDPGSASLGSRR